MDQEIEHIKSLILNDKCIILHIRSTNDEFAFRLKDEKFITLQPKSSEIRERLARFLNEPDTAFAEHSENIKKELKEAVLNPTTYGTELDQKKAYKAFLALAKSTLLGSFTPSPHPEMPVLSLELLKEWYAEVLQVEQEKHSSNIDTDHDSELIFELNFIDDLLSKLEVKYTRIDDLSPRFKLLIPERERIAIRGFKRWLKARRDNLEQDHQKNNEKIHPFPRIFIEPYGHQLCCEYLENIDRKKELAECSFLFRFCIKESIIYPLTRQLEFIEYLNDVHSIEIDQIKSLDQVSNPNRIGKFKVIHGTIVSE